MRNLCLARECRRQIPLDVIGSNYNNNTDGDSDRHIVDDVFQIVNDGSLTDALSSRFMLTNDGILTKLTDQGRKIVWICYLDKVCGNSGGRWYVLFLLRSKNDFVGARVIVSKFVCLMHFSCELRFSLAFVDTEELVCLSHNGAIVTVSPTTGQAELVGEFDHGLEAGCWSPDGEALLLVTFSEVDDENEVAPVDCTSPPEKNDTTTATEPPKKSVLLLMNTQWEVLAETTIDNHVPTADSGSGINNTDASVSIAWRPDGSLCAISSLCAADNNRKVTIYKRESLELHAIGRTEDGSGKLVTNIIGSPGLAWAGPGCSQLLAAAQRKGKKTIQIAFFEPNGLRHREFLLREDPSTQVLGLIWNVDSSLLAVTLREPQKGCDKIQLWHRSNYHWYLKQEFQYLTYRVSHVSFHDENPNLMSVFFQNNLHWREYEIRWEPSCVQLANDECIAYVIDGCNLNLTPLHRSLVPPPMYDTSLTMNSPIRQVALTFDGTHPIRAVVFLSDGSFALVGQDEVDHNGKVKTRSKTLKILARGTFSGIVDIDPLSMRSIVIVNNSHSCVSLLAVICAKTNSFSETVAVFTVSIDDSNQSSRVLVTDIIPLDQGVLSAVQWTDCSEGALLEMDDGLFYEFEITANGLGNICPSEIQQLLEPCPWICGLKNVDCYDDFGEIEIHNGKHNKRLILGLSSRARLYYHDLLLAEGVSSFVVSVSHQYLCYCNSAGSISQLRFLPLKDLHSFDPLMGSDENILLEGYEPRNVERGTRLVAVLPGHPTAVLQVPRVRISKENVCTDCW